MRCEHRLVLRTKEAIKQMLQEDLPSALIEI